MSGVVGGLILAVSMVAMVFTFLRAGRQRQNMFRMMDGPLMQGQINDAVPGSAAQIEDGGVVPVSTLLGAMSWRHQQDEDFELPDEGLGNLLGLVYHRYRNLGTNLYDPTVYDGSRSGRQVWIRLGREYASISGPGMNARRLRTIVTVRAGVEPFELGVQNGRLVAVAGGGARLDSVLAQLAPSPDAWGDVRVVGGADGIVASHGLTSGVPGGWIYDLWLLEHLAARLGAPALEPVELGREWTVPYDLSGWAPSLRGAVEELTL